MSYDIYIGEVDVEVKDYEREEEESEEFELFVKRTKNENAPDYGDLSGKTNGRHPGYHQMSSMVEDTGLEDVFYDKVRGLLRKHPGTFPLKDWHLKRLKEAIKNRLETNGGMKDGFEEGEDYVLAKLKWYEFWMEWALKNCKNPAVENF